MKIDFSCITGYDTCERRTKFDPMLKTHSLIRSFSFPFFMAGLLLLLTSFVPAGEGLTEEVLKYTNQLRQSRGLSALLMRTDLNAIARRHSEDMASGRSDFGHDGFNKRESQAEKLVHPFYGMAENVAYGPDTGQEVVSLWQKSNGHRRNILGDYKWIGIGTATDRNGVVYYTQIFVR